MRWISQIWNILFGILMIFLQLKWNKMISRNFGFLHNWFMRGIFYIFVGTNSMWIEEGNFLNPLFSFVRGGLACFVGIVELALCSKTEKPDGADVEAGAAGGGGTNKVIDTNKGPTLQVNLTPNQLAQGAAFAAANAGTVAAVAKAAAPSAASAAGSSDNPFFGNQHLATA